MRDSEIDLEYGRVREHLMPRLLGRVFHVTCLARLPDILAAGAIAPNPDGERAGAFPSADQSLCRRRGAVSMFDYRHANAEQLALSLDACAPDLPVRACAFAIAVLFLAPNAYASLDAWDALPAADRGRWMLVPFVEACHPGPGPVEHLDEILRVRVAPPLSHPFLDALVTPPPSR